MARIHEMLWQFLQKKKDVQLSEFNEGSFVTPNVHKYSTGPKTHSFGKLICKLGFSAMNIAVTRFYSREVVLYLTESQSRFQMICRFENLNGKHQRLENKHGALLPLNCVFLTQDQTKAVHGKPMKVSPIAHWQRTTKQRRRKENSLVVVARGKTSIF